MLFSDIEGSTRLLRALDGDYPRVLSDQRTIIRDAIARSAGHEMGTEGDSFFVVFTSAIAAVGAAVDTQRALASHPWPHDVTVRVRMGIETGEPLRHEDSYVGIDVHRAARIAGSANGGQIVLGRAAKNEVASLLPAGVTVRDLGIHRLKDLPEPEPLFQLVVMGVEDVVTTVKSLGAPSNLPTTNQLFVGRDRELETMTQLLRGTTRLLTLTGPGGVGKTTLAVALARHREHDFGDGVYFVALEEARTPATAWQALAHALGVEPGDAPEHAVVEHLAPRRALLVLDNLEQIDGIADLAHTLLRATRSAIIATSRGPLHLRAEHEVVVSPLNVPGAGTSLEDVAGTAAVELFVREARRARPGFELNVANAEHVRAICAHLDGLPLAIELAAAQMRLLAPDALARSVEHGVAFSSRDRDRPDRQRTLDATIAWSVDLLSPEDRACFHRLGVFSGGAGVPAVAAVLADDAADCAFDVVERLADVSLVTISEGVGDEPRISMLRVVKDVALASLGAQGPLDDVRRKHAEHYAAFVEHAEPRLRGPEQLLWRDRLVEEQDNLRDALDWALASTVREARTIAVRLATALGWYWYTNGRAREGRERIEAAIGDGTGLEAPARAHALHALGVLEQQQGGNEEAIAAFKASLEVWRSLSDDTGIARELNSLGVTRWAQGDCDRARVLLHESVAVARAAQNEQRVAAALSNLGILDLTIGADALAISEFKEALEIDVRMADRWAIAVDRCNLGAALACNNRADDARRMLAEAIPTVVDLGDNDLLASTLEACAILAARSNAHEHAVMLQSGADALRRNAEIPRATLEDELLDRELGPARAALHSQALHRASTQGTQMPIADLIANALPPTPPT